MEGIKRACVFKDVTSGLSGAYNEEKSTLIAVSINR